MGCRGPGWGSRLPGTPASENVKNVDRSGRWSVRKKEKKTQREKNKNKNKINVKMIAATGICLQTISLLLYVSRDG